MARLSLLPLLLAVLTVVYSYDVYPTDENGARQLFRQFTKTFRGSYSTEEEREFRFVNFKKNLHRINYKNRVNEGVTTFGINQFSDMSVEEFRKLVLMPSTKTKTVSDSERAQPENIDLKDEDFDWTTKGAVTNVKNQGSVGTCWTFGTVGNVEGQHFIKSGNLISLSEELLAECADATIEENGDTTCGPAGGWPDAAQKFLVQLGGIMTEKDYPYCMGTHSCSPCQPDHYNKTYCGPWQIPNCKKSESCSAKLDKSKFVKELVPKSHHFMSKVEDELTKQLAQTGPLTTLVDASDFMSYKSGVLKPSSCRAGIFNHAVLTVGYGKDSQSGLSFWKIKNSWGETWGEKGYVRLQRGVGACGVNLRMSTIVLQ